MSRSVRLPSPALVVAVVARHLGKVHPQLLEDGMIAGAASWAWDTHPWSGGAFAWFHPGQHSALYADRLEPLTAFTRDDLELVTAVAAQTAVAVENARAHERLAREEVARANYSRFMPEYVVHRPWAER